jgi:double-GTPase-like protein
MNRGIAVELDSYRLANYATQVPCLICEQGNTLDAEFCRNCYAPMVLAHQAQSQQAPPIMFAALGPSGVGKTVYLGMLLDMLSRQPKQLQLSARGGFSVTLQQNTLAALARREFPSKTPNEPDRWNWVHCQLRSPKHRQPVELVMPDIAGEALFEEVDHPRSYQVIHSLLSRCHGVLILIDAAKLQSGSLDEDYFTMKLLSHLSELSHDRKTAWSHRPVALIFSKADQCESCFEDPTGYAQRHAPGLWGVCQQRFERHRFFAAGVAGACVTRTVRGGGLQSVPLRIEPRGIVEPFEWLAENLAH